jgi:hypothetical protein
VQRVLPAPQGLAINCQCLMVRFSALCSRHSRPPMLSKATRDDYLKLHTVTSKVYHAPPKEDGPVPQRGVCAYSGMLLQVSIVSRRPKSRSCPCLQAYVEQRTPRCVRHSMCDVQYGLGIA